MVDVALATTVLAISAPLTAAIIKYVPSRKNGNGELKRADLEKVYAHLDEQFQRKDTCEAVHKAMSESLREIKTDVKQLLRERRAT